MATELVGTVRPSGKVQFCKEDNVWLFNTIAKSKNPIHRIKVVPTQQPIKIKALEEDLEFTWLDDFKKRIQTADAVFLTHKDGALRFGSAMHTIDKVRKCYTIATAQEADKFALERWSNLRYFFAQKYDDFRFYLTTMMTHKTGKEVSGGNVDLSVRLDRLDDENDCVPIFEATGKAANEIVDWRKSVDIGSLGRFSIENTRLKVSILKINRPFTFLEEFREEFNNFSYTFAEEKFKSKLNKVLDKRTQALDSQAEASA